MNRAILKALIFVLSFLLYLPLNGEEETNADVAKAEAAYAQDLAEIIADAQEDIEKAQKDVLKVLDRELSKATKKGKFDEAMRLKKKLDDFKAQTAAKEAKALFGDVDIDTEDVPAKTDSTAVSTNASQVPISIFQCNLPSRRATAEELTLLSSKIINPKTNTATFSIDQVRKLFDFKGGYIVVFFKMGDSRVTVANHSRGDFFIAGNGSALNQNENRFNIRRGSGGGDTEIVLNFEICQQALRELKKKEEKEK